MSEDKKPKQKKTFQATIIVPKQSTITMEKKDTSTRREATIWRTL